jgi:hypothetical protein
MTTPGAVDHRKATPAATTDEHWLEPTRKETT